MAKHVSPTRTAATPLMTEDGMLTPEGVEVTPEKLTQGPAVWLRAWLIVFGLCLYALWVVAMIYGGGPRWLRWLDFSFASLSCVFALWPGPGKRALLASPFVLTALLLGAWVVALTAPGQTWLAWWTFAYSIAYFLLGAGMATWRGYGVFYGQVWSHPSGYMAGSHLPAPRACADPLDRVSRAVTDWM